MNPNISVIIPIYKVEGYLERCVNSVLSQDYRNIEVILVDDGSPDRCPEICDDFEKRDERVRVIHKQNGGLSSARNVGIAVARGKYLAFLDSDDQWAEGKLKCIMDLLSCNNGKIDMLVFNSIDVYPGNIKMLRKEESFFCKKFKVLSKDEYYCQIIKLGNFLESACTKIIDREFLVSNKLYFCEGITGEDTEWMFRLLRVAKIIAVSDITLFLCTCLREGSIQNSIKKKNISDAIDTIEKSIAFYPGSMDSQMKRFEYEQCSYLLANTMGLLVYIKDPKERMELIGRLKKYDFLLAYTQNPKTRRVHFAYSILGFKKTVWILGLYIKMQKKRLICNKTIVNE